MTALRQRMHDDLHLRNYAPLTIDCSLRCVAHFAQCSPLALQNPRVVYSLLFQAVAETLQTIARDPKHVGADLQQMEWVVYAKPPMAGPQAVLQYLARYTHRIAITNRRPAGLACPLGEPRPWGVLTDRGGEARGPEG